MKKVCVLLVVVMILAAPALAYADSGTISVSAIYDIGSFGNDSVITINGGLTVTLTNTGDATYTNMQIVCGSSVKLTIDGVKIDDSSNDSACPLSFSGSGNSLVLKGTSELRAGLDQPGVKAENTSSLEISGDGTLTAQGGSQGAGIGGGYNGSGGIITIKGGTITAQGTDYGAGIGGGYMGASGNITIEGGTVNATGGDQGAGIGTGGFVHSNNTILIRGGRVAAYGGPYGAGIGCGFQSAGGTVLLFGGVIYAQKGPFAMNDIGDNSTGDGTVAIDGDAAVFLGTDHCTRLSTSHTHTTITSVTDNKVYGVSANGWSPPFFVYMIPYTLNYNLNGGTGIVPGSVTQHMNTTAVIETGEGLKRNGGACISWNTAADGSGTSYTAGDEFKYTVNTTLYAQYPVMVDEITVTSGSDTVVKTNTLQMSASVLPADAADQSYTWSVENGTGSAVIDSSGVLTGTAAGTVTVKATANDGSGVTGTKGITVMPLLVSGVTVTSGSDTVMRAQTLQMSAAVFPADADDISCTWSVENGTGKAAINSCGLLTGTAVGTVTVKASANGGSGVFGTKEITVIPLLVTISESGTYNVGDYGNDSIIAIHDGLTVKLIDTAGATYANMQISCGTGVKLTIDNISIDDSSNDDACPLSFTGRGNKLILEGDSILNAGSGRPGVEAESGTSLEISGIGVLQAQGGFHGAGIGGGEGGGCGAVTLSGGVIYAGRGDTAPYDIGNGYSGSAGTLSITGAVAVFLKTDSCITPATSHTHETITSIADNKIYGVSANGWIPVFGIYMVPYTLSYSLNGGTGTVPDSITQHLNTTTTVGSGSGVLRANYTFSEWNTAADGSGAGYDADEPITLTADTTLYAQWVKLTLASTAPGGSASGATVYTGGRFTLTPSVSGGIWDWDEEYFSATFTGAPEETSSLWGGSSPATFTALKAGTSTITYTVGGVSTSYEVTIAASELPSTGQDFTWPWLTAADAMLIFAAALTLTFRKRAARG